MADNPAVGQAYGPVTLTPTPSQVAAFVDATGDDVERWAALVPPGFASVALFGIAPLLLADPNVAPPGASVIHTEQRFVWHDTWAVGTTVTVDGVLAKARSRGDLLATSLEVNVVGPDGPILSSTSGFLFSTASIAESDERTEPPHDAKGADDRPAVGLPIHKSASRADLIRYAAATGDWNPVHWDHAASRAAGLPGVVCHGLLLASWMLQAGLERPLMAASFRFRSPVLAAESATILLQDSDESSRVVLSVAGEERVTGYLEFGPR